MWSQFLDRVGVGADEVTVEHVSRFVAWLRAPAENVRTGCATTVTVHRLVNLDKIIASLQALHPPGADENA